MPAGPSTQPSYAPKHPKTHQVLQLTHAEVVPAGMGFRVPKHQCGVDAVMFTFPTTACKCIWNSRG